MNHKAHGSDKRQHISLRAPWGVHQGHQAWQDDGRNSILCQRVLILALRPLHVLVTRQVLSGLRNRSSCSKHQVRYLEPQWVRPLPLVTQPGWYLALLCFPNQAQLFLVPPQ